MALKGRKIGGRGRGRGRRIDYSGTRGLLFDSPHFHSPGASIAGVDLWLFYHVPITRKALYAPCEESRRIYKKTR